MDVPQIKDFLCRPIPLPGDSPTLKRNKWISLFATGILTTYGALLALTPGSTSRRNGGFFSIALGFIAYIVSAVLNRRPVVPQPGRSPRIEDIPNYAITIPNIDQKPHFPCLLNPNHREGDNIIEKVHPAARKILRDHATAWLKTHGFELRGMDNTVQPYPLNIKLEEDGTETFEISGSNLFLDSLYLYPKEIHFSIRIDHNKKTASINMELVKNQKQ